MLLPDAYRLKIGVITTLKFDPNSLKLHHPCNALVNKVLVELVSKSYRLFVPIEHHTKYISISVVTFSYWGNYSRLIVTLPSPSYLASQTDLLGLINSGVTPPSSPVEPKVRLELTTC